MFTSSFFTYRGPGRVAISRGLPRGGSIPFGYRRYLPLAPGAWFRTTEDYQTYRSLYFDQLRRLDPTRVIADIFHLAGPGNSPVLLCFCSLHRLGSWCHRSMAAEWLCEEAGIGVRELEPGQVPERQSGQLPF